eukprot:scaffold1399_cov410-Prasinococcus_capsulatus_cf.AAC.16
MRRYCLAPGTHVTDVSVDAIGIKPEKTKRRRKFTQQASGQQLRWGILDEVLGAIHEIVQSLAHCIPDDSAAQTARKEAPHIGLAYDGYLTPVGARQWVQSMKSGSMSSSPGPIMEFV